MRANKILSSDVRASQCACGVGRTGAGIPKMVAQVLLQSSLLLCDSSLTPYLGQATTMLNVRCSTVESQKGVFDVEWAAGCFMLGGVIRQSVSNPAERTLKIIRSGS